MKLCKQHQMENDQKSVECFSQKVKLSLDLAPALVSKHLVITRSKTLVYNQEIFIMDPVCLNAVMKSVVQGAGNRCHLGSSDDERRSNWLSKNQKGCGE